ETDVALRQHRNAVLKQALRDRNQLTRTEMTTKLTDARVQAAGTQRLAHLVMHAELDGLICSGARRDKQFTYALLEERVPPAKELERDASLAELATRYFTTRGPATIDDFAWWSGLAKADARRAVEATGQVLDRAVIGDRGHWFPQTASATARGSPIARLLPI